MKSIKLLVVAIAFASSTMTFANTKPNTDKEIVKSVMRQEIQKLLHSPKFVVEKNTNVIVKLTVNRNNEIVVLSVEADRNVSEISSYVKGRLNYKKLAKRTESKVYTLPLKILAKL
ncbi:hypothetical protein [Tenacibaculum agarivorans]|uniref:hypothetical protein n=1 Tax=Tenacibaculum agarivorans TaxID=1908389 RepID=UPI000ABFCEF9|nr:hypothetical protein [Tenacibaculum agarivorans]